MEKKLTQLFVAVVLLLLLPLLPLIAEYFKTGDVKEDSLTLCLSFYAFCLMGATQSPLVFVLCLVVGIIESFRYSGTSAASALHDHRQGLDIALLIIVFLSHLIERIRRHCVNDEIFFNFITK